MDNLTKTWSIRKLMKGIDDGRITFDHPIQRKEGQWDNEQQSLLIHSILSDYPIPAIYTIQEDLQNANVLSVIDGKQRLISLHGFYKGKYKLSKDTPDVRINGKTEKICGLKFSELPDDLLAEIINFQLQVYMFSDCTDDEIEEIFFRLNNGTALTKDQKTRVRLGERLVTFVDEVAEMPFFKEKAYFTPLQLKRGEDQTCILQSLMLLTEYNFKNFNNDSVLEFAEYYRDNYDEGQLENCKHLFELLSEAIPKEEVPNKMVKKINIPMFITILDTVRSSNIELHDYAKWINKFINDYTPESPYAELCGAQSTAKKRVEAGVKYMFDDISKFVNRNNSNIGVDEKSNIDIAG